MNKDVKIKLKICNLIFSTIHKTRAAPNITILISGISIKISKAIKKKDL